MKDLEIINGVRHVTVYYRWQIPWLIFRETFFHMTETTIFHWAWDERSI
jgi:hypothetical protein